MMSSRESSGVLFKTIKQGLIQLALFTSIPLVVYLIMNRTTTGFLDRMGLYLPNSLWSFIITYIFIRSLKPFQMKIYNKIFLKDKTKKEKSFKGVNEDLIEEGYNRETAAAAIFRGLITTGLSEEILFRGFIARGLIGAFGFVAGNIIQAIIFALPHALPIIIKEKEIGIGVYEFFRVFVLAICMGWIMMFLCSGSILPLWAEHGINNARVFHKRVRNSAKSNKLGECV